MCSRFAWAWALVTRMFGYLVTAENSSTDHTLMLIIIKTVDSLDFDHHHNFQRSDKLPTDTVQPHERPEYIYLIYHWPRHCLIEPDFFFCIIHILVVRRVLHRAGYKSAIPFKLRS